MWSGMKQIPYFDHHGSPGDATPDPKQVWRCDMGRGEGHADDEQKLAVNGEHWTLLVIPWCGFPAALQFYCLRL